MRILITGSNGQFAKSLQRVLINEELICLSHRKMDISKIDVVNDLVESLKPDVIINTAALRRPGECEKNPELAFSVNAIGPRNLALACKKVGCLLFHTSTDNIFDGLKNSPYKENDLPNPISVYGTSKLAGELFIQNIVEKYIIIRTGGLFGGEYSINNNTNFVLTMIHKASNNMDINVVTDQINSPTYTLDLAYSAYELIKLKHYGIYHITNSGSCSWFDFAKAIFSKLKHNPKLHPVLTDELNLGIPRVHYSVLDNSLFNKLEGVTNLSSWQDALHRYINELNLSKFKSVN